MGHNVRMKGTVKVKVTDKMKKGMKAIGVRI